MRILVVEDEKKVASFIQRGLEGEGFTVDVAYDGESGVELGAKNSYDLILMDVMLPKMDGLSAVKALREKDVASPVLCLGQPCPGLSLSCLHHCDFLRCPTAFAWNYWGVFGQDALPHYESADLRR